MDKVITSSRIPRSRIERTAGFGNMAIKIAANLTKTAIRDISRGQVPSTRSMMLTHKNFELITDSLAHMRGAAMKLGQLMSMDDTNVFPPEFVSILSRLRSSGYAMPPKQLRLIIEKNWGLDWRRKFKNFNVRPFAAASIGQVHRAVLSDGGQVAIKIQFPNIKNSINSDINNLRFMVRASGLLPKEYDFEYYLKICREQLIAETDYLREAKYVQTFADLVQKEMFISVPKVLQEFSTKEILTMSFEEGIELDGIEDFTNMEREHIAGILISLTIREIFEFHLVQTDPNFANFLYDRDEKKLKLLDFGATVALPLTIVKTYKRIIQNVLENNKDGFFRALVEEKLMPEKLPNEISTILKNVLTIGLAELHQKEFFSFADSKVFDFINAGTAQEFAKVVPTSLIPAELLLVQRKLIGLVFLLRRLGAVLPLKEILETHMNDLKRPPSAKK